MTSLLVRRLDRLASNRAGVRPEWVALRAVWMPWKGRPLAEWPDAPWHASQASARCNDPAYQDLLRSMSDADLDYAIRRECAEFGVDLGEVEAAWKRGDLYTTTIEKRP